MSQTLKIPDPLFDSVKRIAEAQGMTPSNWIAMQISLAVSRDAPRKPAPRSAKTLADLFEGRVGTIRSGGQERLSENCGETFTDHLQEKRKAGRL